MTTPEWEELVIRLLRLGQFWGLRVPVRATACFVLAHWAGAGMRHPFMAAVAAGLAARAVATLRYQFPYMEGDRDAPTHCAWRPRPCAPLLPRQMSSCLSCRSLQAASRSAAA